MGWDQKNSIGNMGRIEIELRKGWEKKDEEMRENNNKETKRHGERKI